MNNVQDILYFLARGYYTLPPKLKASSLFSYCEKTPPSRYSRNGASAREYPWDKEVEDCELCMQSTLARVTERFAELSVARFSDPINEGRTASYHRDLIPHFRIL